ncbi:GntR family transcriptional regulator [Zoogloea oryzae]|uniref:GntR family transcriptional regulator n=1 Tax=Zoogloea oryzae TaxID=310767 RepID=A0ABQ6F783_9RHOO|nr:FadR/GntR family transcriptional regulator [Zoogloea oryzae]GLT20656.1 GntR family transcriptional regulator [Zoogloea oryzae]
MAATRFHQINRPQRLSDAVGSALEKRIRSGALKPGERLPTEAQLGAQFAVSRAVVREAVARLKAEGLVESRQGSGVFVATRPGAAAFRMNAGLPASAHDARDVFELRLIVEAAAAERAAVRHTPESLTQIGEALAAMDVAMESVADSGDGAGADDAFHCAVAAASGNPLIHRFIEFVSQEFSGSRQPTWSRDGRDGGLAQASQNEHRALFEAIAAGDPAAARAAAERHIVSAAGRLGVMLSPRVSGPNNEEET